MLKKLILPPGPRGNAIRIFRKMISSRRLEWFDSLYAEYGDIVGLRLLSYPIVIINHPDYAREILLDQKTYSKDSIAFMHLKKIWGNSLFSSTGKLWKHQRSLIQPKFHKASVMSLTNIMSDAIDETVGILSQSITPQSQIIDFKQWMNHVTLQVTIRALFGVRLSYEEADRLSENVDNLRSGVYWKMKFAFMADHIPSYANWKFKKDLKVLFKFVDTIIERKQQHNSNENDLLTLLLHHTHAPTTPVMDKQLLTDEIIGFILAGYETTCSALCWFWLLILKNPECFKKLKAEIQQILGDRPPNAQDYPALVYTRNCFTESLRLFPSVPIISRQAKQKTTLGGYEIPKYTEIFVNNHVLSKRPDQWVAPEQFNPDRFLNPHHPFTFLPFSGGSRKCIGYHFAYIEAVLIIATILQKFDVQDAETVIEDDLAFMSRPKQVAVRLKKL